jgi:hypothetical protein
MPTSTVHFRDLLHAANLRHGTHGFTYLPKDDVLKIFPPLKIRWLRPGLNPLTWVPEASTLIPRPPKPPIICVVVILENNDDCCNVYYQFLSFGAIAPQRATASSLARFLDHTQRRTTVGKTRLHEWSARRRDIRLTTHNTHNRQTSMPPVGFEHTISASERPKTYAIDRAATGTGFISFWRQDMSYVKRLLNMTAVMHRCMCYITIC